MRVSSKVTLYNAQIKILEEAQKIALSKTADFLKTEVGQAQVVPRDQGALSREKFFIDYTEIKNGKVSLVHEGPYARRLYYHPEYHFNKDANPNAKGKWFDDWAPGGIKEKQVHEAFARFMRGGIN